MAENKMTVRKNDSESLKWKEVTIGGISGIVLGTAGAYAANKLSDDDIVVADDVNPDDLVDVLGEDNPLVATGVNDSMSFSQAFAAARSEVGAGGTFVWHGKVYGTYYANEWNAMSPAERHEFTHNAITGNAGDTHSVHGTYAHNTTSHDTHTAAPADNNSNTHNNNHTSTGGGATTQVSHGGGDNNDDEVEFLGVTQVDTQAGGTMNIGHATIQGEDYYFIDVDNADDRFDYIAHDNNHNNKIDEDEIEELGDVDISVSDFHQMSVAQGNVDHSTGDVTEDPADVYYTQADDMPDYVNDADTGELA